YTLLGPQGTEQEIDADWAAACELLPRYVASVGDERCDHAMAIMALTPLAHTESVLPFLDDPDMWIPERAADVLGARKFAPAVPRLAEVARTGRANGAMAAMRALEAIGTTDSLEQLRQIRQAQGRRPQ